MNVKADENERGQKKLTAHGEIVTSAIASFPYKMKTDNLVRNKK